MVRGMSTYESPRRLHPADELARVRWQYVEADGRLHTICPWCGHDGRRDRSVSLDARTGAGNCLHGKRCSHRGFSLREFLRKISPGSTSGTRTRPASQSRFQRSRPGTTHTPPTDSWQPITPIPRAALDLLPVHQQYGRPPQTWTYTDAGGRPVFLVARFVAPDGGKVILPLSYGRLGDGAPGWRWKAFAPPRPLYGLHRLSSVPDAPVLIVEGEKTCVAAQQLLPGYVCLTWSFGAKSAARTDWSPLRGRDVTLWPDADEPGARAMAEVARLCAAAGAASIHMVKPPDAVPAGWDLADALEHGWTQDAVREMALAAPPVHAVAAGQSHHAYNTGAPEPAQDRSLDHIGNANRFADQHAGRMLFVPHWDEWMAWTGKRWQRDVGNLAAMACAERTARSIRDEDLASLGDDGIERSHLLKWARTSARATELRAMLLLASNKPGMHCAPADFDCRPMLFNCANGTLDLATGELRPHNPADRITQISPVEFDPAATCPIFEQFLGEIMAGNADVTNFLLRVFGYALTGSVAEQCFFIFHGTGRNGKSTLIEVMKHVFGDYAVQASTSTFALNERDTGGDRPRSDLVALRAARFVPAVEINQGRRLDEALIKSLTGGEPVVARELYGRQFTFYPVLKLFMAVNHLPEVRGQDVSIWRRIMRVHFGVTIPEERQDRHLLEKLKAESAGILNLLLRGCQDWQRGGLQPPAAVARSTAEYRHESDALAGFLDECCVKKPGVTTGATALYQAYKQWCDRTGEHPWKQKTFGSALRERGVETKRVTGGKVHYIGIALEESVKHNEAFSTNSTHMTNTHDSIELCGKPFTTVHSADYYQQLCLKEALKEAEDEAESLRKAEDEARR